MKRIVTGSIILGVISIIISIFQFNSGDNLYGGFSVLYSAVFLTVGFLNIRRANAKKQG